MQKGTDPEGGGGCRDQAEEDESTPNLPDTKNLPKLKAGQVKKIKKKLEALHEKKTELMDLCSRVWAVAVRDLAPGYVVKAAAKVRDDAVAFGAECFDA